jgi:WXG100 family type VII secretion target
LFFGGLANFEMLVLRLSERRGVLVAAQLKVDPIDLHMSSHHMDVHRAEFSAAHAAANSEIEGAQTGWVGASAIALQAKLTEWQTATARLADDIGAHGAAFRSAANGYAENDVTSAKALDEL